MMQLFVEAVTTDLAVFLRNESGKFIVRTGGQDHVVVCESGHSIKSFMPIFEPAAQIPNPFPASAPRFHVVKVSNDTVVAIEEPITGESPLTG